VSSLPSTIQGLTNEKSHGTVVLAAFSGNVDEAVRTEKRPSITAPARVVKDIFRIIQAMW
jgi:hypothetical protein